MHFAAKSEGTMMELPIALGEGTAEGNYDGSCNFFLPCDLASVFFDRFALFAGISSFLAPILFNFTLFPFSCVLFFFSFTNFLSIYLALTFSPLSLSIPIVYSYEQ